ncbi:unnamed protein product, partial [Oppiella nova]
MCDNCGHHLSEVKTRTNDCYYLLSDRSDTGFELTLVSAADGSCLRAAIDYEAYRQRNEDNESTKELDDKREKVSEALRIGSKRVSAEDGADYSYGFDVNTGDHRIQLSLRVMDGEEVVAESPLLTIACRPASSGEECLREVFAELVSLMDSKNRLVAELTEQNRSLRELSERSVKDLDRFVVTKEENDSLLYTRFA